MNTTNPSSETIQVHHITQEQLPLSCPRPDQKLWSAHPRVYLPIEASQQVTCPYCGAIYILD